MKNQNQNQLEQWNKTIKIEVSLDQIASQLHGMFKEDEKHSAIVVNAIIGNLEKSPRGIGQLFGTLNGHIPTINFKVGDRVVTEEKDYNNILQDDGTYENKYVEIGECQVVTIDMAAPKQLLIEWTYTNRKGESNPQTKWVGIEYTCKIVGKIPLNQ